MKTRNVIGLALAAVCVTVSAFAFEPVNSRLVVLNPRSGVFKVIYEGAKSGKVSMKITDKRGHELFRETRITSGFIRPVNFEGLTPGAYTIEITDQSGKLSQTVQHVVR